MAIYWLAEPDDDGQEFEPAVEHSDVDTLYVTEAEFDGDDVQLFGYCLSPFGEDSDEWGYALLAELQSTRVRGLTIERDLHFPIATRTVADALTRVA